MGHVQSAPRDVALDLLRRLKAQGKVLAYEIDEAEPDWWTIRLVMAEKDYFDPDIQRQVVRQITDAIDRQLHIFTLVRLIPEHRAGHAPQVLAGAGGV